MKLWRAAESEHRRKASSCGNTSNATSRLIAVDYGHCGSPRNGWQIGVLGWRPLPFHPQSPMLSDFSCPRQFTVIRVMLLSWS